MVLGSRLWGVGSVQKQARQQTIWVVGAELSIAPKSLPCARTCVVVLLVGPSSVPAFCDSSVPAGIHSFLPAWWAQMSQIDGSPLCSKPHKCSTHKYCVGADDLRCFGALQLLENIVRNCHRCLLWVTCGTIRFHQQSLNVMSGAPGVKDIL